MRRLLFVLVTVIVLRIAWSALSVMTKLDKLVSIAHVDQKRIGSNRAGGVVKIMMITDPLISQSMLILIKLIICFCAQLLKARHW
jgi:hypothetical protein